MNKDQLKGRAESAKGKTKEVVGKATGNKDLENKGKIEHIKGKAQSTFGDIMHDLQNTKT